MRQENVGGCIRTYFELMDSLSDHDEAAAKLGALRDWLEARLEIAVTDETCGDALESLRFSLAEDHGIEGFRQRTMINLRQDRCHAAARLNLEFRVVREIVRAA